MYKCKKELNIENSKNGITLIALIITIIILLILAGVTINVLIGDNGLFSTAKKAGEKYEQAGAREKLEAVLLELQADKITKPEVYNENEYINNKLKENNMKVEGDIVTVEGWQFEIDRTVPKIAKAFGQEDEVDTIIASGGKYIYNEGKVLEEAEEIIGEAEANSEYAINEKSLFMTTKPGDGYNSVYVGTKNRINLEGYTKIKCLVSTGDNTEGYSSNTFKLVIQEEISGWKNEQYKASKTIGANQTDYILEFEIPDDYFNKECYIGAMGSLQNVYIYKIWLEKSETKMLYDYGKTSKDVEGFIGFNDINSEYAINEKNLFMTTKPGNGYNLSYIGTKNKIDLTGYNKIRCLVSTGDNTQGAAGNWFNIVIQEEEMRDISGSLYKTSRTIGANQTEYNLSFTIPDECKNGNYYIGASCCLQNVYIYKIWLEK